MIKELFAKEKESLNYFLDHFDQSQMEKMLFAIRACEGIVFLSGVGKSGLIAQKIAQTMTSTGTRALYISPTDALHGDIGIVTEKDLFVLLSKSGESDELVNLIPILRNKHVQTIALVSNLNSRLARGCNLAINLPINQELCPYDLAPTISTTAQMIFGDVLAIALMRLKNFSQDQFVQNHPAGRLGKRITMKVEDLMVKGSSLPVCKPQSKLVEILVELSDKRCGCILITDEQDELKGIFTDGDLRRALQDHGEAVLDKPIQELMTVSAKWTTPSQLAWDAMRQMETEPKTAVSVLPVLQDDKKVVGLIKLHDIIQSGI